MACWYFWYIHSTTISYASRAHKKKKICCFFNGEVTRPRFVRWLQAKNYLIWAPVQKFGPLQSDWSRCHLWKFDWSLSFPMMIMTVYSKKRRRSPKIGSAVIRRATMSSTASFVSSANVILLITAVLSLLDVCSVWFWDHTIYIYSMLEFEGHDWCWGKHC